MEEKYKQLITDMSVHAQAEYPLESCGLITTSFSYVACKNLSQLPKESFFLDPVALLEHEYDTWAIVHSHPGVENPLPSEEDLQHTVFDEYKFIVGFAGKFFIYWYDDDVEALRYEPFEVEHIL